MSYVVLARKYRPQQFENVVAQEHVTRTLSNALKNNKIGSGYLFCGPRGTGKTTVARILAKCINCENGPTPTPCGECPSCVEIAGGASLDVLEIDAASNTGVDDIRQLRENVRYLPTKGNRRMYIIDEVHRLSASAFDALLKTLEEPPAHVVFVFATTEPMRVPDTIHSRTQRFDFRRVSADDLAEHLVKIAAAEGLEAEPAAVQLMARKGDGSVRDALSLLDQVAAFSDGRITEQDVVDALGLVDRQFLMNFTAAVAESNRREVLQLCKKLFEDGIDVSDFTKELLEHFRLLLLLKADADSLTMLGLGPQEQKAFSEQAEYFKTGDILRLIKILTDLVSDLKAGLDERLLIEVASVRMAELESTVSFEQILAGLPEETTSQDKTATPSGGDLFGSEEKKSPKPEPKEVSAPAPAGRDESRHLKLVRRSPNLAQLKADWPGFLGRLKGVNPMIASQLSMGTIKSLIGNKIQVVFKGAAEGSMRLVQKPDNYQIIRRTLDDHFRVTLDLEFVLDPNGQDDFSEQPVRRKRKRDAETLLASSPRLKKLLEKVNGEIIGIRDVDTT